MKEIINRINEIVKEKMTNEYSGHDYWHVQRVYNNSLLIAKEESQKRPVNIFVVQLAALLHDIGDYKLTGKAETLTEIPKKILAELQLDTLTINSVLQIIGEISFHKQMERQSSIEAEIVQDADRLDAIGAVGIARAFAYGGANGREIWNPDEPPRLSMSKEEYMKNKGNSINHFYEKLLLLKDKMNTDTGKRLAIERHEFMEEYLKQFYIEWNGEK